MRKFYLLALATSSLLFSSAQSYRAIGDRIVAIVGDEIILQSDVENALGEISSNENAPAKDSYCSILDHALLSKVFSISALRDSLTVSDEEVEAELEQRIRFWQKQLGGREALELHAGKTIYQLKDDSRAAIRERRLVEAMEQKLTRQVRLTPAQVAEWFGKIPREELPLLESEMEIGQLLLLPKTSSEMTRFVEAELNHYRRQAAEGKAGFAELVKKYSQGETGILSINRNDKSVEAALVAKVFKLKRGEISEPVLLGNHSMVVAQLLNRRGDEADVMLLARNISITETEKMAAGMRMESIVTQVKNGLLSFDKAVSLYDEDPHTRFSGPWLTNGAGRPFISFSEMDREMLELVKGLVPGDFSKPVPVRLADGRQGLRVFYLKSATTAHRLNLQDDYEKIAGLALADRKKQVLTKWMEERKQEMHIELFDCKQLVFNK